MSANLNLIKLPVDTTVLIETFKFSHEYFMARAEVLYEYCDPDTEIGRKAMADLEDLVKVEAENYNSAMELVQQNNDLQTKNNILTRALQVIKENKEADAARLEDYRVRLERIKESQHKRDRNSRNTAAWNDLSKSTQQSARR